MLITRHAARPILRGPTCGQARQTGPCRVCVSRVCKDAENERRLRGRATAVHAGLTRQTLVAPSMSRLPCPCTPLPPIRLFRCIFQSDVWLDVSTYEVHSGVSGYIPGTNLDYPHDLAVYRPLSVLQNRSRHRRWSELVVLPSGLRGLSCEVVRLLGTLTVMRSLSIWQ